jgi:hypothetical protein
LIRTGEEFYFHFNEGWEWQRELGSYMRDQLILRLKARQRRLWLGIGYCEWKC